MTLITRVALVQFDPSLEDAVRCALSQSASCVSLLVARGAGELAVLLDSASFDVVLGEVRAADPSPELLLLSRRLRPETPFIALAGPIGEDAAADCMRRGAADVVSIGNLVRLPAAIAAALPMAGGIEARKREREAAPEEEALHLAEARMHHARRHETLGNLAGGVAHEFNNILTSIVGNAELLRARMPEASAARLDAIRAGATRAGALVQQLLAYAGRGRFDSQPVDLRLLSRAVADEVAAGAGGDVGWVVRADADTPVVIGDPARLEQAVLNLVANAVEALGDDAGTVRISTACRTLAEGEVAGRGGEPLAPGPYAVLSVSDTGPGLDRAALLKVFEPFYSTKFLGRGLGLAATQGIAHAHGGAVLVESRPGSGATFRIVLPAMKAREPVASRS